MSDEYEEYEDDYQEQPGVPSEPQDAPLPEPEPIKRTRAKKVDPPPPITEVQLPSSLQGVVRFTRSLNLGSRDNNIHVGIELAFAYQPNASLQEVSALAADAFFTAKSVVFEQASIPFTIDDGGIIHEVLREVEAPRRGRAAPRGRGRERDDEEPEEEPRGGGRGRSRDDDDDRDRGRDRGRGGGGRGRRDDDEDDELPEERPRHIKPAVWRDLVENPDDWWDNRRDKRSGKYSGRAPDFKNRETGEGIWLRPPRQGGR